MLQPCLGYSFEELKEIGFTLRVKCYRIIAISWRSYLLCSSWPMEIGKVIWALTIWSQMTLAVLGKVWANAGVCLDQTLSPPVLHVLEGKEPWKKSLTLLIMHVGAIGVIFILKNKELKRTEMKKITSKTIKLVSRIHRNGTQVFWFHGKFLPSWKWWNLEGQKFPSRKTEQK